ncbi:hypothetical protein BDW69DRAFT_173374 [Aspergillus filifer]
MFNIIVEAIQTPIQKLNLAVTHNNNNNTKSLYGVIGRSFLLGFAYQSVPSILVLVLAVRL